MYGSGDRLQALLVALEEVAFCERASAQILLGWNAKVPELTLKLEMARHAHEDLEQALGTRAHVQALTRGTGRRAAICQGLVRFFTAIDRAPGRLELFAGLYTVAKRRLLELYGELAQLLDPIYDAAFLRRVPDSQERLERQIGFLTRYLVQQGVPAGFVLELEELFSGRRAGPAVPVEQALWAPVDRAPLAARPAELRRAAPGALRLVPEDSTRDPRGIGLYLHNLINGELTTMELCGRNAYEHPDLPAAFHLAMARQSYDEARHARAIARLAEGYGTRYGDHPIYTLTYDGYYCFAPVEPGSRRELCWRLLLRGTIDEGLALDDFAFQVRRREHLEQPALAELFRYLMADELFHAQAALRWSSFLLGDDPERARRERALAQAWFSAALDHRRQAYVAENPELARQELESLARAQARESRYPLPGERTLNLEARREAGYGPLDLEQLIGWGYARPA